MEEDFIAPEKVQALIWKEAVSELLVVAVTAAMVECQPETKCMLRLSISASEKNS
jgi:hypothetical protein